MKNWMITLITDFGATEYVGAMKGIIFSICPKARIVDITHNIKKFDIRRAAYAVYSSCKYFPKGTVHVVVVDPGVGTDRRSIIIKTEEHLYVGPDNGVFSFIDDVKEVYEIEYPAKSRTFHGRDVFAPIAAYLECGASPKDYGKLTDEYIKIVLKKYIKEDVIGGEVICVDDFGNVITNIKREDLEKIGVTYGGSLKMRLKGRIRTLKLLESYGFSRPGDLITVIGSEDYLEISVNQGNAAERLKIKGGEELEVFK